MADSPASLQPIPRPPGTPAEPSDDDPVRREIAAEAARLIAESGLDYGSAKRKAVESLFGGGRIPRGAMPDNAAIDRALGEHLTLFDDEHPRRVARMRAVALALMRELADFNPYLTGAVWKGIVAEHAPIHLQLFADDVKLIEIGLLDRGIGFEVTEVPHFRGDGGRGHVEALALTWRGEPVMLSLYPSDDLRGALRGMPAERGDAAAVGLLLALTAEPPR